jgi:hypothetical protein
MKDWNRFTNGRWSENGSDARASWTGESGVSRRQEEHSTMNAPTRVGGRSPE